MTYVRFGNNNKVHIISHRPNELRTECGLVFEEGTIFYELPEAIMIEKCQTCFRFSVRLKV